MFKNESLELQRELESANVPDQRPEQLLCFVADRLPVGGGVLRRLAQRRESESARRRNERAALLRSFMGACFERLASGQDIVLELFRVCCQYSVDCAALAKAVEEGTMDFVDRDSDKSLYLGLAELVTSGGEVRSLEGRDGEEKAARLFMAAYRDSLQSQNRESMLVAAELLLLIADLRESFYEREDIARGGAHFMNSRILDGRPRSVPDDDDSQFVQIGRLVDWDVADMAQGYRRLEPGVEKMQARYEEAIRICAQIECSITAATEERTAGDGVAENTGLHEQAIKYIEIGIKLATEWKSVENIMGHLAVWGIDRVLAYLYERYAYHSRYSQPDDQQEIARNYLRSFRLGLDSEDPEALRRAAQGLREFAADTSHAIEDDPEVGRSDPVELVDDGLPALDTAVAEEEIGIPIVIQLGSVRYRFAGAMDIRVLELYGFITDCLAGGPQSTSAFLDALEACQQLPRTCRSLADALVGHRVKDRGPSYVHLGLIEWGARGDQPRAAEYFRLDYLLGLQTRDLERMLGAAGLLALMADLRRTHFIRQRLESGGENFLNERILEGDFSSIVPDLETELGEIDAVIKEGNCLEALARCCQRELALQTSRDGSATAIAYMERAVDAARLLIEQHRLDARLADFATYRALAYCFERLAYNQLLQGGTESLVNAAYNYLTSFHCGLGSDDPEALVLAAEGLQEVSTRLS